MGKTVATAVRRPPAVPHWSGLPHPVYRTCHILPLSLLNMKIAFVGKGGSGKTTLSSLFIRHLAALGTPVIAVDADINQHLGVALGLTEADAAALPAMGAHLPLIKDYLRG